MQRRKILTKLVLGFFGYEPSNSISEKSESVELVRNPDMGFSPVSQIQTLILDFGISRFSIYNRNGGKSFLIGSQSVTSLFAST